MSDRAWRNTRLADALARDDLRARVLAALDADSLCNHCLGRLMAEVDTGLSNEARGAAIRAAIGSPPPAPPCSLCGGLFETIDAWADRAQPLLGGWEFERLAVSSHADPTIVAREEALWQRAGGDLAEPYKQEFNRLLAVRLGERLGCDATPKDPDVILVADHAAGTLAIRVEPLFACGRYRKLVRGIPQCRWRSWPTSVQQIAGDPILRAAGGEDHLFHGCGREDVDVRCLGERPFVIEVVRPRRRRLDWAALADEINRSGQVEVLDLARCAREAVARLKGLRPEKSYRALVRLSADVDKSRLANLANLVGPIHQETPTRVLKRRSDLVRRRRVVSLEWRRIDARTLEIEVRTQAGTYIKELVSGDAGRTRPSVAAVLGATAECAELDVIAIHIED